MGSIFAAVVPLLLERLHPEQALFTVAPQLLLISAATVIAQCPCPLKKNWLLRFYAYKKPEVVSGCNENLSRG